MHHIIGDEKLGEKTIFMDSLITITDSVSNDLLLEFQSKNDDIALSLNKKSAVCVKEGLAGDFYYFYVRQSAFSAKRSVQCYLSILAVFHKAVFLTL